MEKAKEALITLVHAAIDAVIELEAITPETIGEVFGATLVPENSLGDSGGDFVAKNVGSFSEILLRQGGAHNPMGWCVAAEIDESNRFVPSSGDLKRYGMSDYADGKFDIDSEAEGNISSRYAYRGVNVWFTIGDDTKALQDFTICSAEWWKVPE